MSESWFAGDHGPEGVWKSEKGGMLAPPELPYDEQAENMGPERLNQEVSKSDWRTYGPVLSGTFDPNSLTRGTDKHMPK